MDLHPDFKDLLQAFADEKVEYLIIGGYAVGYHARPRFTKDIDLWVGEAEENLRRVAAALHEFGAPPTVQDALAGAKPDEIVWMGAPPARVDILQRVPGGDFSRAYANRIEATWGETPVRVISRAELIALKQAVARPQDLLDVRALERTD